GRTAEPLGRHPTDPLASADIHLVAAAPIGARVENLNLRHGTSPRRSGREPLSRHSNRHGDSRRPLPLREPRTGLGALAGDTRRHQSYRLSASRPATRPLSGAYPVITPTDIGRIRL